MKTVVINAGPKRKDINAQFAKSLAEGAESTGADVEYVDLYKFDLSGCHNCQICKKEGKECKCYWRDELSPLIDRILDADCLLIAVPIFFTEPTSHYRALIERLIFCIVSYDVGNAFKGKVNVGLFYTVNYDVEYFEKSVRPNLKSSEDILKMLNGELKIMSFENISQNIYNTEDESSLNQKEEQLNSNLDIVFDLAFQLSK